MNYKTTKEIAFEWGMTAYQISKLCSKGLIDGAFKEHNEWRIPADAPRVQLGGKPAKFRFIDLFAGIGGFHQAMKSLGGVCVMAAEIDKACVDTYKENFKTIEGDVRGDVTKIDPQSIPPFEVLCAGFPCQPFSKAGLQKGFNDESRGNLFYSIMDILDSHDECEYVVLENVRNLADKSENWSVIKTELLKRDFIITKEPLILSPTDFGIPQIRERVYILGIKREACSQHIQEKGYLEEADLALDSFKRTCGKRAAFKVLEKNPSTDRIIPAEQKLMLEAWDEFKTMTKLHVIGFPIWISCFGAGIDDTEYFRKKIDYYGMPAWKRNYVDKNRELYLKNRDYIDKWLARYNMDSRLKIYQKFEWNCGTDIDHIKDGIIQIRQSGIRVKRPNFFPSLVAMVNTPIIWDEKMEAYRRITPREAANLQSFKKGYKFKGSDKQVFKQLGNSVNVRVLEIICSRLFYLNGHLE